MPSGLVVEECSSDCSELFIALTCVLVIFGDLGVRREGKKGCRAAHVMISFMVQSSQREWMRETSRVASSAHSFFSRSSRSLRRRSALSFARCVSCLSRCASLSLCFRSLSRRVRSHSTRSASLRCRRAASSATVNGSLPSLLLRRSRGLQLPASAAPLPVSLSLPFGSCPRGLDLLRAALASVRGSASALICPASTELLRDLGSGGALDSCCFLNSLPCPQASVDSNHYNFPLGGQKTTKKIHGSSGKAQH